MLDELDQELTRRGHRFCRYGDDCNIYVRSHRSGERVMASVSRFLTKKLRLKVNETKSAVARPEERQFLGFSISNDQCPLCPVCGGARGRITGIAAAAASQCPGGAKPLSRACGFLAGLPRRC